MIDPWTEDKLPEYYFEDFSDSDTEGSGGNSGYEDWTRPEWQGPPSYLGNICCFLANSV